MIAITVAGSLIVSAFGLLVVDIYLHNKYQMTAGFNVWGYRGPVAGRKRADEYRVVMLGGSTAFGYGVDWRDSIPALLERKLTSTTVGPYTRFTVVNLGYNNEGAFSFRFTLEDYLALHYDAAIFYEGYNDAMGDSDRPNTSVFRRDSPIFRLTGYLPISPVIFKEKAALLTSGNINSMYLFKGKTVFRPSFGARTAAEALRAAAAVEESLETQMSRVVTEPRRVITGFESNGCRSPWQQYCHSMEVALAFALAHGAQVTVVTQPYEVGEYMGIRHREQQRELRGLLERQFGDNARVRYVDLGERVDLTDKALSYDRMHLTAAGNERIADSLVEPITRLAALRASGGVPLAK